jgi:transposase
MVSDELWAVIAPFIPDEPRPKCGQKRIEWRSVLEGILCVLRTGIPWELLPQKLGWGSGMTCWRRLRDWQQAGVWCKLHHYLLKRLGQAGKLDWSRAALDSSTVAAPSGGADTGRNPADRGKSGCAGY